MKFKDYNHLIRKVKVINHSRSFNNSLVLKKFLRISFLLILFLPITILHITNNINGLSIDDQLYNEIDLKSSNQGDSIFKLTCSMWTYGQNCLDPHQFENTDVLNQVFEGLFRYDLSDPNLSIIQNLANGTGTWSSDKLHFTILLKNNVTFHDGTKFNASAVQWSFNRLAYFMNISGTLPSYEYLSWINWVYRWSDYTPIINRTEINDVYNITFVLNRPFAAFPGLLCFQGSYILSPTSSPFFKHINYTNGVPVGTGPFKYDRVSLTPNTEVRLHAFENYWRGKPQIGILRLVDLDIAKASQMLKSGEIDLINNPSSGYLNYFEADPNIDLVDAGKGVRAYYLGMNNEQINKTWRQAISYSINYTYITDIIMEGQADRLKSPLPESILFANWSLDVATYNVTRAREIMQSMGFGGGWDTAYPGTNEAEWTGATFATFNYSYHEMSTFYASFLPVLQNTLDKIGINVTDAGLPWMEYSYRLWEIPPYHRNMLQLIIHINIPNYNDPNNYIDALFHNTSMYNYGLVNDTYLENLMQDGLNETDLTLRKAIYDEIQRYLIEDLMPCAYLFVPRNYDAYYNYIIGYQSNPMDQPWFYNVTQNSTKGLPAIYVDGNEEWQYFKDAGKCTGEGTISEPYIIEDLVIDGWNKSMSCILIENSDVYFRIENCTLFNSANAGIELNNVSNSQIIGNNFSNNNFGIYLDDISDSNIISTNVINNNIQYGAILHDANNNVITNNTFIINNINAYDNGTNNSWNNGTLGNYWDDYGGVDANDDGIGDTPYLISGSAGSQDNSPKWDDGPEADPAYIDQIFLNSINKTIDKSIEIPLNENLNVTIMYIDNITKNFISGATVQLRYGVSVYNFVELFEQYTLLINTTNLGLGIHNLNISAQAFNYTMDSVIITVNVRDYFVLSPFVIDNDGGGDYTWAEALSEPWCSGSGTLNDPYLINNILIDGENSSSCLEIRDSNLFFILRNCTLYDSSSGADDAGIKLSNVSNATLVNVNCSNNNGNGIYLYDCQEIVIMESHLSHNKLGGIFLDESSFNFIINNSYTIYFNFWGIYFSLSNNNTIIGNAIGFNKIGLYFFQSNYNVIANNTFDRNQEATVEVDSHGNEFSGNEYLEDIFDNTLTLTIVIVAIVSVVGVSAVVSLKRTSAAKKSKEAKKSRLEDLLYDRLDNVDRLISEDNVEEALKNIEVIRNVSKEQGLYNITNQCEEKIRMYEKYEKKLEKVKFTAGYPGCINPGTWLSLVIFLHIPSLQEEVQKKIKKIMKTGRMGFHPTPAELDQGIKAKRGTRFKFIPRVKGFRFNPPSQEVIWYEDYHEIEFRLRTEEDFKEQITMGCVEVYKEGLPIAKIPLSIKIGDYEEEITYSDTEMFEKVFISYAHLDENVVDYAVKVYNTLPIEVLRDKDKLRIADDWEKKLMHMIEIADSFQLFWSNASKDSPNVENEWRHAIKYEGLKGVYFIHPLYWEVPMPQPPEELKHLHFHKLDLDSSLFEKQFIP